MIQIGQQARPLRSMKRERENRFTSYATHGAVPGVFGASQRFFERQHRREDVI
jgi:hypothetical protein